MDIDDQILHALFDFIITNSDNEEVRPIKLCDTSLNIKLPDFDEGDTKMYFETLLLHPVQINLTYARTGTDQMQKEGERYYLNPDHLFTFLDVEIKGCFRLQSTF